LFLFVYRPAFTRGMAMVDLNTPGAQDPPYFSETLLKVSREKSLVPVSAELINDV
jgi:hypothetical protein